jgi:UDP-N-acetylmuramate dehydrogenase
MTLDEVRSELIKVFGENRVKRDEVIAGKVTSRIGGKVVVFVEVQNQNELIQAVTLLKDCNQKYSIIGTGSNTIVSDEGFDGIIIKNNARKFEILSMKGKIKNNKVDVDKAYLYAESGCILNQIVRYSLENGMAGLEDLLGTPGSVGGFIRKSLMTNERNIAVASLYQIRLVDKNGELRFIDPNKEPIKDPSKVLQDTDVILSVTFLLTAGDEKKLWDKATKNATEKEKIFSVGRPLGILFKDITLSAAMSAPTPGYTTSASELIRHSDGAGVVLGNVCTMEKDGNVLLATGDATTKEIVELVREIRSRVFKKFGVKLEMQLKILK